MPEGLTPEELDAIQQRSCECLAMGNITYRQHVLIYKDIPRLIADLKQARAANKLCGVIFDDICRAIDPAAERKGVEELQQHHCSMALSAIEQMRLDLAEANRKLDRVRKEVDGECDDDVRQRVLAILDDSAAPRPVPETRIIIDAPELIPDELCVVTVTMNASSWAILARDEVYGPALSKLSIARVPALSLIAQRLNEKCWRCLGTGVDPADESETQDNFKCSECGGTGKQSVPGARFAPVSNHVECK